MKKIMMLLMVAVLMLGISGQAMASFEEGHLVRVVYSGTGSGTEYITDLGDFSSLTSPLTSNNALAGQNTFSLANLGASATLANTNVAYFIVSFSANEFMGAGWVSGAEANGGYANVGSFTTFFGAAAMTTNTYGTNGLTSVTVQQPALESYWQNMNQGQSGMPVVGTMGGWIKSTSSSDQNLGALATVGYVDQMLYYYGTDPDNTARGTQVAVLRTFADGRTELQAVSQVPIPAAAYLFGTGLMGLVGLRRKMVA